MNKHKDMVLGRLWLKKKEKNKIISFLDGNYEKELFDLLFKIYKREKEYFLN